MEVDQIIRKRNHPIVINFANYKDTNMHYVLEEIDVEDIGDKKRVLTAPKDVWLEPVGFFNPFPQGRQELDKRYKMLLENGSRIVLSDTKHRGIIIYLPADPNNLPKELKNTWFGQAIELLKEIENEGLRVAEILRKEGYNRDQIMDLLASQQTNEALWQGVDKRFIGTVAQTAFARQTQPQQTPLKEGEGQK